jgi:hypothetical protein
MELSHQEETKRRGRFSRLHLSWPMLFLAGWLLYQFTAQPGLGALVACAKFGWADIRTAFWLRRVDPDRRRGKTCFWAYLTYGLWKVGLMSTLVLITIGLFDDLIVLVPRPFAPKWHPVLSGVLTAIAMGFSLSLPTAYIALWSAWRNGVRVWLGNAPTRARKAHFWPPRHGRVNMVFFVGSTTLLLTIFVIVFVIVSVSAFIESIQPNRAAAKAISQYLPVAIALLIIAFFRMGLLRRRLASSPEECWTVEEGEEAHQAQFLRESKN